MICAALEITMWITKPGNPGWQAKILSIITTGFGNMDHFNHAVRRVMKRIDGLSTRTLLGACSAFLMSCMGKERKGFIIKISSKYAKLI